MLVEKIASQQCCWSSCSAAQLQHSAFTGTAGAQGTFHHCSCHAAGPTTAAAMLLPSSCSTAAPPLLTYGWLALGRPQAWLFNTVLGRASCPATLLTLCSCHHHSHRHAAGPVQGRQSRPECTVSTHCWGRDVQSLMNRCTF